MSISINSFNDFFSKLQSFEEKQLKQGVKFLRQKERFFVLNSIEKMKGFHKESLDFHSQRQKALANRIVEKILNSSVLKDEKVFLIVRIWRKFLILIGLRCGSKEVLEKVYGSKVTNRRLVALLEDLKKSKDMHAGERINFLKFLKARGFSPRLKRLDFSVEGLLVYPQSRIPFGKPPCWGSDLFKKIDFGGITFEKCRFSWVDFSTSRFECVNFVECDFGNAVFLNTALEECTFKNCSLNYGCFERARLKNTSFEYSKLEGAAFFRAELENVGFFHSFLNCSTFLDAKVLKKSKIKSCHLKDCYLFDKGPSFAVEDKGENLIKSPLIGLLWNHHKAGIAGNKILRSASRNGAVPFKIHYDEDFDRVKLKKEVESLFEEIFQENSVKEGGIPFLLLQKQKEEKKHVELNKVLQFSKRIIQHLDALILPGGDTDIPPEFYGVKEKDIHAKTCPDNDYLRIILEFALINEAIVRGIPLMGICRGCQLVNIFFGGDLTQHVTWQNGLQIYYAEKNVGAGILSKVLKKGVIAFTNHHQANKKIADNLAVIASFGSVPKALESKYGAPTLLTQFHPEFFGDDSNFLGAVLDLILSEGNAEIFKRLIACAKAFRVKQKALTQIATGNQKGHFFVS